MESLIVEFLEPYKKDYREFLINGVNLCNHSFYSDNLEKLFIYDIELFNELKKYQVKDIIKYFNGVSAHDEIINKVDIDIELNPRYYKFSSKEKKLRISISLRYEPEDWNKQWSIKEHANAFFEKLRFFGPHQTSMVELINPARVQPKGRCS